MELYTLYSTSVNPKPIAIPNPRRVGHHHGPMERRSKHSLSAAWLLAATSLLASCNMMQPRPVAPTGPSAADVAFQNLADRYLNGMLAFTPVAATELGDHRFDDRLDDAGPTARDQRTDFAHKLLADVTALDTTMLSRPNQVDARLLKRTLEDTLWRTEELKEWRWNPLLYTTLAGQSIYSLMERDFAPLPARLNNAAARLEALPRFLAQMRDALDPALVPRIHAETAAKQNAGIVSLLDELIVPQVGALPAAGSEATLQRHRARPHRHLAAADLAREAPFARRQGRLSFRCGALRSVAETRARLEPLAAGDPHARGCGARADAQ